MSFLNNLVDFCTTGKDSEEYLYRYDDYREHSGGFDVNGEPMSGSRCRVSLEKYRILKHTPKGVQINCWGVRKFVNLKARKRFACPTKEEAKKSFIDRKKRQRMILKGEIDHVEDALRIIEGL